MLVVAVSLKKKYLTRIAPPDVAVVLNGGAAHVGVFGFFFSSRRRHTKSVSAFLLNRSSDLDLVASLPLIKERILVIILLLHFLSLMLGSVLVLMLPLLVWLTPDLRIKKSLLKCNWTIRKRLPRCKMRLKKRLLAFSR